MGVLRACSQLPTAQLHVPLCTTFRDTLTYLGPSFIKAGQVLANRPDIVREDYMNELCCLQVCGSTHLQVYACVQVMVGVHGHCVRGLHG